MRNEEERKRNRDAGRRRYARDPQAVKAQVSKHRDTLKAVVRSLLGGACECCGEDHNEFLTVDHRAQDGGGSKRKGWYYDYLEIRRAFDSGEAKRIKDVERRFRVLCWNCNLSAKMGDGVCAHRREKGTGRQPVTYGGKRMKERFEFVKEAMGGKCACCAEKRHDFLSIDHIDGNAEADKSHGRHQPTRYYLRIERAFRWGTGAEVRQVLSEFQLLCHNCNQSKHRGEVCLHNRHYSTHPLWPYAGAVPAGAC